MAGEHVNLTGGDDATIKRLCRAHVKLQEEVARLCRAHVKLQEEVAALRTCLDRKGIVAWETLEVEIHRSRFEAVQRSSQWTPELGVVDVLDRTCFTSNVVSRCVVAELAALRATSTRIQGSIEEIEMKLYVVGGGSPTDVENSVHRYDPHRSEWEAVGQMRMGFRRKGHGGAVHRSCIYIAGASSVPGAGMGKSCLKYDFDGRRKWEVLPALVESHAECTLVAVAGLLIVAGGFNLNDTSIATAECLNVNAAHGPRTWRLLPPMLAARGEHAATVVSNRVFVLGGLRLRERQVQEVHNSVESFDIEEHRWGFAAPLPVPVCCAAAATIRGKIYLAGGLVSMSHHTSDTLFCLDPALDSWTTLAPMLRARCYSAAAVIAGRLFVCGGLTEIGRFDALPPADSFEASMEVFDPRTGAWAVQPPMLSPNFRCSFHASAGEHIIT